jgi:hypothetical protein
MRWPRQAVVFLTHRNSERIYRHFTRLKHELRHTMPVFLCLHRPRPDLPDPPFRPDIVVSVEDGAAALPVRHAEMQRANTGYMSFNDLACMPALLSPRLAEFDHCWLIEYDVDFSGDWKTFFEWAAASKADLIGFDFSLRPHSLAWVHWKRFAVPETVSPQAAMRGLFCLARFSRRFLEAYQAELRDPAWAGMTEALYPTVARHRGLSIATYGSLDSCPGVLSIGDEYSDRADLVRKRLFNSRPIQGNSYFHEAPEEFTRRNYLFHPIKVDHASISSSMSPAQMVTTVGQPTRPAASGHVEVAISPAHPMMHALAALALGLRSDMRDFEQRPLTRSEIDQCNGIIAELSEQRLDLIPHVGPAQIDK